MTLRRTILLIAPLLTLAIPSGHARPESPLSGVNLAGGEFNAGRRPGLYGRDYIYPDAEVARPFLEQGLKIVRVPVLWERLQPTPLQPLDTREIRRLDKALATLSRFRIVILDLHNYARRDGVRLDQLPNGAAMLADLWTRLADRYRRQPHIAFGLMNEPYGIDARHWRTMVDRSVAAIRQTGAENLVLIPGTRWTGAHSWMVGGAASNAAAFAGFRDPANHYAFELHQYVDTDSSGTKSDCVSDTIAGNRLQAATNWLRREGHRGFLGEFGAGPSPACLAALGGLLDHMQDNADVWMGWAYWAGGGWWGRYPFSIQPSGNAPRPQAALLARYIDRSARP